MTSFLLFPAPETLVSIDGFGESAATGRHEFETRQDATAAVLRSEGWNAVLRSGAGLFQVDVP